MVSAVVQQICEPNSWQTSVLCPELQVLEIQTPLLRCRRSDGTHPSSLGRLKLRTHKVTQADASPSVCRGASVVCFSILPSTHFRKQL